MNSASSSKAAILLLIWLVACQSQSPIVHSSATPITATFAAGSVTQASETVIRPTSDSEVISPDNVDELVLRSVNLGSINAMLYADDGRSLYVSSSAGIYAYDTASYQEIRQVSSLPNARFSPDAKIVLDWRGMSLFSLESDQKLYDLELPAGSTNQAVMTDAVFSEDGSLLAQHYYDSGNNKSLVWRLSDGALVKEFKGSSIRISTDSRLVATQQDVQDIPGSDPNAHVFLYDLEAGEQLGDWRAERPAFLSGDRLVIESERSVHIIDTQTLQTRSSLAGSFAAFSADEKLVAVLLNDQINIHQVSDGRLLRSLEVPLSSLDRASMAFSADGQALAAHTADLQCCGGYTDNLSLWRVENGSLIAELTSAGFSFTPDAKTLLSGGQVIRVSDGSVVTSLRPAFIGSITNLAFTPDGQEIIVASYDDLYVYQVEHDTVWLPEIADPEKYQPILQAMSPNAAYGLLDIQKREVIESPDGQFTAQLGNGQVALVSGSGGVRFVLPVDKVTRVAFSLDGQLLAVGQLNGSVELWNVSSKEKVFSISSPEGLFLNVGGLAFSPDGTLLAIGLQDGTVSLYGIPGK